MNRNGASDKFDRFTIPLSQETTVPGTLPGHDTFSGHTPFQLDSQIFHTDTVRVHFRKLRQEKTELTQLVNLKRLNR